MWAQGNQPPAGEDGRSGADPADFEPAGELVEQLLELDRYRRQDGGLPPALDRRRLWLEERVAPSVEGHSFEGWDPVERVRSKFTEQVLLPGVYGGLVGAVGRAGKKTLLLLQVLSAVAVGIAGAAGPLLERPLGLHLLEVAETPLPFVLVIWGLAYPWILSRAERETNLEQAGLPAAEGPLLAGGTVVLLAGLLLTGASWSLLLASALLTAGVALMATTIVRPAAAGDIVRAAYRNAYVSGVAALESMAPAEARVALERAAAFPRASEDEGLSTYLRTATVLEAEGLRLDGHRLLARALLASRGIRPEDPETVGALDLWSARVRAPRAELFEAAGLLTRAARLYREQARFADAVRCYEMAAERAVHLRDRAQAALGLVEVGQGLDASLLESLLDEIEVRGGSANEVLRVLSALPLERLESEVLLEGLRTRLARQPAERGVSVVEALVGSHKPHDCPGLYGLLAEAYRRLGHRGTARRIEAEIGPSGRRWSAVPSARPQLSASSPSRSSQGSASATKLDTGDLEAALSDRYELLGVLGEGAMGKVHLAEDRILNRRVALKVLRPNIATDLFVKKFQAEARVVAQLNHPGIVRVFDAGQVGPWTYFVMELVEGPDLATLMAQPQRPPLTRRLEWVAQVAEAMAYAHGQGVIHRDLKPANILVAQDGRARVTDFGIAHVPNPSPEATAFSQAGMQVGTPIYMAPEQLGSGKSASPSTDVYALGLTLFFVVTGRLPFEDNVLAKINVIPPRLASEVPEVSTELEWLVEECLAPEPRMRLQMMTDFSRRLRDCPELCPKSAASARRTS